jgi:hypothetical protein
MFAFDPARFVIGAGAVLLIKVDCVLTIARLTRDNPFAVLLRYVKACCYFKSSLFSRIHIVSLAFLGRLAHNQVIQAGLRAIAFGLLKALLVAADRAFITDSNIK